MLRPQGDPRQFALSFCDRRICPSIELLLPRRASLSRLCRAGYHPGDQVGSDEDGAAMPAEADVIRIMRASGRERLELRQSGGRETILLTYRVLNSHGRQQLVLFQARLQMLCLCQV